MQTMLGAVEAGGTKCMVALVRRDGTVAEQQRIATTTPAETLAAVLAFFRTGAARHGPIGAIGVASFGPIIVDRSAPDYGTIARTPKPGWQGTNWRDALATLGIPVTVDTDVNGAALGEWTRGAGQGCRTMAYTTVGTGIGTGVVHDGTPLAGFSHYESGHIRVPRDAARDPFAGTCPFHGDCLEGLAAGPAIKARFGHGLDALPDPAAAVEWWPDTLPILPPISSCCTPPTGWCSAVG